MKHDRMHYEVWPGPKTGDPFEIRETWATGDTFGGQLLYACGKTVEYVEEFLDACMRCNWMNGGKNE